MKQKAKNSLHSAEKQLARTEAKVAGFGEVVDLVELGLQAGYKLEDLRALLAFLIERNIGKTLASRFRISCNELKQKKA